MKKEIAIPVGKVTLTGDLHTIKDSKGLVIFSHGSGSSRMSPRNRFVAGTLEANGFSTLLFDLLTAEEDREYKMRFDIDLLSNRLISVTQWIRNHPDYRNSSIGYFGASTGAASAIEAAASLGPDIISAVVSRGGRPDLATSGALNTIKSPTLLIVGGLDTPVLELNEQANEMMDCLKILKVIPGASHLFEEPGKLEQVTRIANDWFLKYLHRYQINIEKDYME